MYAITKTKTKFPTIEKLSDIGETYVYKGKKVVPSQFFAAFCEKSVKDTNKGLNRLVESGRLEEDGDYFKLFHEELIDFMNVSGVPDCHPTFYAAIRSRHGITFLTRKAVNTLSHYFNNPASVNLSNTINSISTQVMEFESNDAFVNNLITSHNALLKIFQDNDENRRQIKQIQKENDEDTLTSTQIDEIDHHIINKFIEFGRIGVVCGLIKRKLKKEFFKIASTRTYKEIPRHGFDRAVEIICDWFPTDKEMEKYNLPLDF